MKIIMKYIIRSCLERKFRSILIILAVAISGALFYSASVIKGNLEDTYRETFIQTVGNADILITSNEDSPGKYISPNLAKKFSSNMEYLVGALDINVNYKLKAHTYDSMMFKGMNLDDYELLNDLYLIQQKNVQPFTGNKIIISELTAKYYNLKLEDTIEVLINGRSRKYEVVGIAAAQGIFFNEAAIKYGLVPFDKLSQYADSNHYPTSIYIKLNNKEQTQQMINQLSNVYAKYDVKEPFTQEDLDEKTSMLSMILLFVTSVVSFMSVFMIYSSFKVIMIQKTPNLGTFRSVGADKKYINRVMLLESIMYGIIGAIIGCILGIVLTYILKVVTMPASLKQIGIPVRIEVSILKLAQTFVVANLICLMSCSIPIIKTSNIPIKNIVLNIKVEKQASGRKNAIMGIALLGMALIIPKIIPIGLSIIGILIAMPSAIAGCVLILPLFLKLSITIISPLIKIIFRNEGKIALKNIRNDVSLMNSATLIMIGVTILLLVSTLTNNLTKELIVAAAEIQQYDVQIGFSELGNSFVSSIKSKEGVDEVIGINILNDIDFKINGKVVKITQLDGVGGEDYFKFENINVEGKKEEIANKLQESRNIIMTKTYQTRYKLKEGDTIEIDFSPYGGTCKEYTIIGFIDTVMQAGNFAMIGQKYLQMDSKNYYYSCVLVNVKEGYDVEKFMDYVKETYKEKKPDIITGEKFREDLKSTMSEMVSIVSGFAVIATGVGCIGIINNFLISFVERKRSLAVLKSIGMNKKQIIKMLFVEAMLIGVIGSCLGVVGGSIAFKVTPLFLNVGKVYMPLKQYPSLFLTYILGGGLVAIIASISPSWSSSKLNIIEEIKFE